MKTHPVISTNPKTGEECRFPSCRSAERAGFNRRNIWQAAHGRRNHHRGLKWRYLDH
jgi:hypothetical protein